MVKNRKKVLSEEVKKELKKCIIELCRKADVKLVKLKIESYYLHLLVRLKKAAMDITVFVNVLKTATSRRIRKKFPALFKDGLWEQRYLLVSSGRLEEKELKEWLQS